LPPIGVNEALTSWGGGTGAEQPLHAWDIFAHSTKIKPFADMLEQF
jgi:hypothetical protein